MKGMIFITNKSDKREVVPCSQFVVTCRLGYVVEYVLYTLEGEKICGSSNYLKFEEYKLNLNYINILPGTKLELKCVLHGMEDCISQVILEYQPNSATTFFEINSDETSSYMALEGTILSPSTPPILRCTSIHIKSEAWVIVVYSLVMMDGTIIYTSEPVSISKTYDIYLSDISVPVGTNLYLKAVVEGGSDAFAYMLIQYYPEVEANANLLYDGVVLKSVFIYYGTD